jgi:hypothetical protein
MDKIRPGRRAPRLQVDVWMCGCLAAAVRNWFNFCHVLSPMRKGTFRSTTPALLSGCPVITLSTTHPSRCLSEPCRYLIASMGAQFWPHPISSTSPLPSFRSPRQIDGSGLPRYPLCVYLALRIRVPCLPSSGGEGSADDLAREALIPFVATRFSAVHAQ